MFKLTQTDDYEELRKFFIVNELEVSEEEGPVPTDIVKCWRMTDESFDEPKLIGGVVLARREGEYIIDGIATDSGYRKQHLGKRLLAEAVAEVKRAAGTRIFLVARAPGFFRTQGFERIPKEGAPDFFECLTCPQFEVSCHPEVMKLDLPGGEI